MGQPINSEAAKPKFEFNELGLVVGYYCPSCGGELKLDHTDDIQQEWFKCEKCGEQTSKPKSKERLQLEAQLREEPQVTLKDLVLPWSGMVVPELDFVVEPLGNGEYVWHHEEEKGIAQVYEVQTESDKKTTETRYAIHVEGQLLYFADKPKSFAKSFFNELPFRVPRRETIRLWVSGQQRSKDITVLFHDVEDYIRLVLDLEEKFESKICAIWIFQTWLRNVSEWAGNLDVGGAFGSGKTTCIQALAELCYHAIRGTTTPAALARMNEKYGCTWVIDEYDKARRVEENLLDMFIRQGDRRGIPVWRYNTDKGCEESFDPFGAKLIDYHSFLETALKQRSIYHLKMTKSQDSRLPIINQVREKFSQRLFEELFLWYLDNATKTQPTLPDLPELPSFAGCPSSLESMEHGENSNVSHPAETSKSGNSSNVDASRQTLFNLITADMSKDELSVLSKLQARAAQLGFIVIRVAKTIGLKNYIDELREAFEIKALEEEEPEYDETTIIREVLLRHIKDGMVKQSDVYKEAVKLAREEWGQELTSNKFGRVLRDLGFREKKTIKRKVGGVRWLILDVEIQTKLSTGEVEPEKTLVNIDDLTSVYWANSLFGEHECGICGYKKMTSWQGETNKGDKVAVCEDCQREWDKRRESA